MPVIKSNLKNNTSRCSADITHSDSKGLRKDNSWTRAFVGALYNFFNSTALHGVKYIIRRNYENHESAATKKIKIFFGNISWIIACFLCGLFSAYMMQLVMIRFNTIPTVTTVDTFNHPIWEVPFPAVTVCNANTVHKTKIENLKNVLIQNNVKEETVMNFFSNLSNLVTFDYVHDSNIAVEYILLRLGYTIENIMLELIQPCEEMLQNCSWLGEVIPCKDLFRMIKTVDGFCCSFNYKALKAKHDKNYDNYNMSHVNSPIKYVSGIGEHVGLTFIIDTQPENYIAPIEGIFGAEIFIHHAMDMPDMATTSEFVSSGEHLQIGILPEILNSQPEVRKLDVIQRNCWYEDEKDLYLVQKYSFESCMSECRAAHGLLWCHCIPFMYPVFKPTEEEGYIRQCAMRDLFCLRPNRHLMSSLVKHRIKLNTTGSTLGMDCDCLPSCSTILYKIDSTVGVVEDKKHENISMVYVFFKELTCTKYRRDPFVAWDELFAALGGILSLCLGGSIISIIEFLYFYTFKLFSNLKMYRYEFQHNYLKTLWATKTSKMPAM